MKKVGAFTLDGGTLTGPATYMQERGNALADRVIAGDDDIFNMTARYSPDIETAILVRIQTDYAAWLGTQLTLASLKGKE